jgi:hypothetical protein
MTLEKFIEENSAEGRMQGVITAATKLGIGHWTIYRLLRTKKASRTVALVLESKGITLK